MQIVRSVTTWGYKHVAKPLLFRRSPDDVHTGLLKTAQHVQKIPGVRSLPKLWAYKSSRLEVEAFGLTFKNPVGLSAGFDKNLEMPGMIKSVGFGFMTGGSITWGAYEGNPRPWFYRLPSEQSLVVNAGLPNVGTKAVIENLKKYPSGTFKDFPLIISVAKTNSRDAATDEAGAEDYCKSLALLDKEGFGDVYEINISCPNTFGGEPFTTPDRLELLLGKIDALELKKPITIKMPIDKTDDEFRALLDVVKKHNVAGLTIANLQKNRAPYEEKGVLKPEQKGNLSGGPTREVSTHLVKLARDYMGKDITIIGVGGIFNAAQAQQKLDAGANLVALITGMIYQGPQLIGQINHDLAKQKRV